MPKRSTVEQLANTVIRKYLDEHDAFGDVLEVLSSDEGAAMEAAVIEGFYDDVRADLMTIEEAREATLRLDAALPTDDLRALSRRLESSDSSRELARQTYLFYLGLALGKGGAR